ncbi:hypothetical protein GGS21DRAFT_511823 [Xylaria nigripes]|nr:hypothetical protein GGS21DRAFT_511823 [Xylaria nigripes]
MDTLSNVVASTAKLILGDKTPTTQEPVSGRRGDPSKGEPYDAGNMEPISEDAGKEAVPDEAMTRRVDDGASPKTNDGADNSSNEPSMTKEPGISPEGQTDTRPVPQDNKLEPKSAATDIHETPEGAPDETQNFDGPGPRPIEEVAKESGGDASNNNQTVTSGAKTSIKEADDKEEGEGEGEGGEGDSSGSTRSGQTEQHKNKGTGELYVRSSGMHADGGDFDATKPGAGREADSKPTHATFPDTLHL